MSGFTIFLALLKTIGILGLWLLAAAFLFLFLILFVPVRYRAEGSIDDREGGESFDPERVKKASRAELHISWLLHILRIRISFPDGIEHGGHQQLAWYRTSMVAGYKYHLFFSYRNFFQRPTAYGVLQSRLHQLGLIG